MAAKRRREIAVIGAGAKAAAIAAKAAAMSTAGVADVGVTIFEQSEIGSNWSGAAGYTDGAQRLCTPIERDIGFPYTSLGGAGVDAHMFHRFAWASFLMSEKPAYRDWVDAGRQAPSHAEFAKYLQWVVKRTPAMVVKVEVCRLTASGRRWTVWHKSSDGRLVRSSTTEFDGVVVSGPGPSRKLAGRTRSDRIFDGQDFWLRIPDVNRALKRADADVAIVGAGGTAAAVLAWLVRHGHTRRDIVMVAEQASLFTRGESVFENRLFSDDAEWGSLSMASRREFVERLNRGVVWSTVMSEVQRAKGLSFVHGRATRVNMTRRGEIKVDVLRGDDQTIIVEPHVLIDASGFDAWWFLDLVEGLDGADRTNKKLQEELEATMTETLRFDRPGWRLPNMHAPLLSSAIGPGFGSLMALGSMSDRVLRDYV